MTYKRFLLTISSSIVQYFNYAIFSFSALELSAQFMPGTHDKHKLLNFFAAIMLTVLARPLGSIVFGQIGDKSGRKFAIILSGIVSSIGAILVPFIPNFSNAGIIASIMLIISRMIFLSGLSGEIDGVRLYVSENFSAKKQNLGNGLVTLFTQSGALLAAICLYLLSDGWRTCFLIGGICGISLSLLRNILLESLEYAKERDHPSQYYKASFLQIINGQAPLMFKGIILSGSIGCMYQFFIIYFPIYAGLDSGFNFAKYYAPYYIGLYGLGGLFWGYVADRIGGYKTVKIVLALLLLKLCALAYSVNSDSLRMMQYILLGASFLLSGFSVPTQMLLKQSINVGIRYRIFSLSHSIGSLVISTPTSFICTKIAMEYGGLSYSLLYPSLMIILSFFALRSLPPR